MANSLSIQKELAEWKVRPDENTIAKVSPGNCNELTIIRVLLDTMVKQFS